MRRPILAAWLLILGLLRCQGQELGIFCIFVFWLVFDCGMDCIICMSLFLLVKIWVLLKLQSVFDCGMDCMSLSFAGEDLIAIETSVIRFLLQKWLSTVLPALWPFLFHPSYSRDLIKHRGSFGHIDSMLCLFSCCFGFRVPRESFSLFSCLVFLFSMESDTSWDLPCSLLTVISSTCIALKKLFFGIPPCIVLIKFELTKSCNLRDR